MTSSSCGPNLSTFLDFSKFIGACGLVTLGMCLLSSTSFAQQIALDALPDAPTSEQASAPADQNPGPDQTRITIPAGTRLALVLTHSVDSNVTHSGDEIFAQTTAPVILNDQVVIPAGTFVQGKVEKLTRRGTQAEMLMRSASLVFPDGNIAHAGGPVSIVSDQWTAWNNPSGGHKAAIILVPFIAVPIGSLIGSAADGKKTSTFAGMSITTPTHKGLVIGTTVGFAAGLATSIGLMAHSRQFYIDAGSALSMRLSQSITLTQAQIKDANDKAATQPPPVVQKHPPPTSAQGAPSSTGPGSCTAGQDWCNGQCVDSFSYVNDSANCGRCGNRCSISETCTGGSCTCGPGYTSCMGQCKSSADFISDNQNCGSCGNSCGIGESCFGGSCRKLGQ